MNSRLNRWLPSVLAAVCFLSFHGSAQAAEHKDEWITAMIKMELWTTNGVPSMDVFVDTANSRVVLSGKVKTASERDVAEQVARKVEGVTEVRNLVQIVPPRQEKAVARADKEIEAAVKRAFASERALARTGVVVASVNNGVVLLTGKARTFSEHLVAVETARLVKGVRTVGTQVQSPRELGDNEIGDGTASRAGRDFYTTAAVKLRLLSDRAVPGMQISVDSRYGMVVLFGTVPTEAARTAAGRHARKVAGVDRVINDLQVVPEVDRKMVAARDDVVEESIKQALEAREEMKKVDVSVKNAVVHLTGSVVSVPAKLRAAVVARSASGVHSVDNDLQIKQKE